MKLASKGISKSSPTWAKGGGSNQVHKVPNARKSGKMPKEPNLGLSLNPQKGPKPKKR